MVNATLGTLAGTILFFMILVSIIVVMIYKYKNNA